MTTPLNALSGSRPPPDSTPSLPTQHPASGAAVKTSDVATSISANAKQWEDRSPANIFRWSWDGKTQPVASESDKKAVAALDTSVLKKKIQNAVNRIRSLLYAGLKASVCWDLAQLKAVLLTLPQLHDRLHNAGRVCPILVETRATEELLITECLCITRKGIAQSVLNQIDWFQGQVSRKPNDDNPYARIYAVGLQIHFARLLETIVIEYGFIFLNTSYYFDDITYLYSKGRLDPVGELYAVMCKGMEAPKPPADLRDRMISAVDSVNFEELQKLLDNPDPHINIVRVFEWVLIPDRFDRTWDPSGGLFAHALRHFCGLKELTKVHFKILDLLIDAGSNWRGSKFDLGGSPYDELLSTFFSYRGNEKSVILLIKYLADKGLNINDYCTKDHKFNLKNYEYPDFPMPVALKQALEEVGLVLE